MWCSAVLVSFGLNQSQVLRDLHLHPLLLAVVDQSAAVGVGRGARVEVVGPLALVARTVLRMSERNVPFPLQSLNFFSTTNTLNGICKVR